MKRQRESEQGNIYLAAAIIKFDLINYCYSRMKNECEMKEFVTTLCATRKCDFDDCVWSVVDNNFARLIYFNYHQFVMTFCETEQYSRTIKIKYFGKK